MSMVVLACYIIAFASAGLLAWGVSWLELRARRQAAQLHWTEQARALQPARAAASFNAFLIPACVTLGAALVCPEASWPGVALVSYIGGLAGLYPMEHALYPQMPLKVWVHLVAAGFVIRGVRTFILVAAILLMPPEFDWPMMAIVGSYVLLRS